METIKVRLTFSQNVTDALKSQGRSKKWFAESMDMTAPTLDARLKNNDWRLGEIIKASQLLQLNGR